MEGAKMYCLRDKHGRTVVVSRVLTEPNTNLAATLGIISKAAAEKQAIQDHAKKMRHVFHTTLNAARIWQDPPR